MTNLGKLGVLVSCAIVPFCIVVLLPENHRQVRLTEPVTLSTKNGEDGYLRSGTILCVHQPWFPLESGDMYRLDAVVNEAVPVLADRTNGREPLYLGGTRK
jgi:hypothetical protein